jgi:hypothetical protein
VKRSLCVLTLVALSLATPFAFAGKQQHSLLPSPADPDSPAARDRVAPDLQISVTPKVLADPNGRMRAVEISGEASDDGDIEDLYLASVTSDEPGDAADIAGEQIGTFDNRILLRAESSPRGNGRTYRITYVAVDSTGNRAIDTATVAVPAE